MLNPTEAAAQMAAKDAEIARLREAHRRIVALDPGAPIGSPPDPNYFITAAQAIARAALQTL